MAITGGPGIAYNGPPYWVTCNIKLRGVLLGLYGYGSAEDPDSYIRFSVGPEETMTVRLYFVDSICTDNEGFVEVSLYKVKKP
jgi:hypothetical protein